MENTINLLIYNSIQLKQQYLEIEAKIKVCLIGR